MPRFDVYFEFYQRKMKTTVDAYSQSDAADKVRARVNILRIQQLDESTARMDKSVEDLMNMFGMKK